MFYLTFGQKYRYEPHPTDSRITPDGLVLITTDNEKIARKAAFDVFGKRWSGLYEHPLMHYYPDGVVATVTLKDYQPELKFRKDKK